MSQLYWLLLAFMGGEKLEFNQAPRTVRADASVGVFGKGQMGSALMGPLQISCFLTEGFLGTPVDRIIFIFPKVPGRTFFPNLSTFITSAAAPLVLTPFVRNQGYVGEAAAFWPSRDTCAFPRSPVAFRRAWYV